MDHLPVFISGRYFIRLGILAGCSLCGIEYVLGVDGDYHRLELSGGACAQETTASYERHSSTARLCSVQYQTTIIWAFWCYTYVCVCTVNIDICSAARPKLISVGRSDRKLLVFPHSQSKMDNFLSGIPAAWEMVFCTFRYHIARTPVLCNLCTCRFPVNRRHTSIETNFPRINVY